MQATALRKRHNRQTARNSRTTVRPKNIGEIVAVLTNPRQFPTPIRPVGSNSASTRCTHTQTGTALDMTAMNKLLKLTTETVTVQAGMRLCDLTERLAADGFELIGGYEFPDRTVGGAISSGSLTAAIPDEGGHLASSVRHITMITAKGKKLEIGENLRDLMRLARLSYGLLGVICLVELRIRPIRPYMIRNRKMKFDELSRLIPVFARVNAGVKISLLPFRDRAFVELRQPGFVGQSASKLPWKIKDWACNTVLPKVVHSMGRALPIGKIRGPLIDRVSEATESLVNKGLLESGSNAAEQTGQFMKHSRSNRIVYCTWLFPSSKFDCVVPAYRNFCRRHYQTSKYRCDLPAIAYRINRDQHSLLSPTVDESVFALNVRTTNTGGWENFLIEYAEFANRYDGIPLFNQTKGFTAVYAAEVFGKRLEQFQKMRRRLDPENRLLNQFFAEHVG